MQRALLAMPLIILSLATARGDECLDKAASQSDMNACAAKAYETSDSLLNKLFRQIEERLSDDAGARKRLVAAQRAWVAFRDAECLFSSSDSASGARYSAFPMVSNLCLDGLTRKRIDDFKSYLNCEEGDVSCRVPASK